MNSDKPKEPAPQEIVTRTPPALDFRHVLVPDPEEVALRAMLKHAIQAGITGFDREHIEFLLGTIDRLREALRYREILAQPRDAATS